MKPKDIVARATLDCMTLIIGLIAKTRGMFWKHPTFLFLLLKSTFYSLFRLTASDNVLILTKLLIPPYKIDEYICLTDNILVKSEHN